MSACSFLTRLASQKAKVSLPEYFITPPKVKYHYQEPRTAERLGMFFSQHLQRLNPDFKRPLIIVAIGTDSSTGDSLGPLAGTKLAALNSAFHVFGTLEDPVHASNLNSKLREIEENFQQPLIVAIDASLGQADSVGTVTLAAGALKPGTGVRKELQEVGEVHFTGIVNVGGYMEYFVLQNTRLGLVWKLAELIALSIKTGYELAEANLGSRQGILQ